MRPVTLPLACFLLACGANDAPAVPTEPPAAPPVEAAPDEAAAPTAPMVEPRAPTSLADCFPAELGGLTMMRMPPGMFADRPFARAYLERTPGGRAININVWDAATDDIEGQLTQYPVLGQEGVRRESNGAERVGGTFESLPSEAMWEELSSGGHRDTLTVRLSETRLVSLNVSSNAHQREAATLMGSLDVACLAGMPLH